MGENKRARSVRGTQTVYIICVFGDSVQQNIIHFICKNTQSILKSWCFQYHPLCNHRYLVSAHSPYEVCCISYSNACLVIHTDERGNKPTDGWGERESQAEKSSPKECEVRTHRLHSPRDSKTILSATECFHRSPALLHSLWCLGDTPVSCLCVKVGTASWDLISPLFSGVSWILTTINNMVISRNCTGECPVGLLNHGTFHYLFANTASFHLWRNSTSDFRAFIF